jgi:hypothetical protein
MGYIVSHNELFKAIVDSRAAAMIFDKGVRYKQTATILHAANSAFTLVAYFAF